MYARAVEDASKRLYQLRSDERQGFVLGFAVLALSVAATQVRPALAIPLFIGGIYTLVRVVRAAIRRCDLIDSLAALPEAYVIPEVAERGNRVTTMTNRRSLAASLRSTIRTPRYALVERIANCAGELEALASELEREELELDPVRAVACQLLLTDGETSPLLNLDLPADDLVYQVHHIRSGFTVRPVETRSAPGRLNAIATTKRHPAIHRGDQ